MYDQIEKYSRKLISDRAALPDRIAFAAQDDAVIAAGDAGLARLAAAVLERLNCLALCAAAPALPFADFLLQRAGNNEREIVPRDTETRTFLHDIPILRHSDLGADPVGAIARVLGNRKGVIVQGIGIVASGALTVEQAFINWSSVFHSTFIKYLEDVLRDGFKLPDEARAFEHFRTKWLARLTAEGLIFRDGPLRDKADILDEMARVGRYTVERGLVDSFFGNISYSNGDLIYISQTASSLDELAGCIDPVPFENSSTVGITASSELVAHRRIFETAGCRAILHGHPRFAVVMSMLCDETEHCPIADCWKECPKVRILGGTPVVAGEIGAGGIAKNVPPVIGEPGRAIVYGHGVFTLGRNDFAEAFQALVDVENWCREEYFRRFGERYGEA
ncbi:aldolase [Oryzomonas sagensis]|uniref:Aldolase n=1 Tax=Oryzomonas sagensis TaxID=2603857 RepID=A0ABQ6TMY2_9BACT|nr:class II aldolase/adducin family protein [Oryzomonas sagensis]KAB0669733.1 aldolase [Oryzomonas sagensis]